MPSITSWWHTAVILPNMAYYNILFHPRQAQNTVPVCPWPHSNARWHCDQHVIRPHFKFRTFLLSVLLFQVSVCMAPQLAAPAYTATYYKLAVARSKTRHQLSFTDDSQHFRECCAIHINLQVINHSLFQTRHMVKLRRVGHASKLLYCAVGEHTQLRQ
jgi:hypothetical protein